jgi:hypothetical protein
VDAYRDQVVRNGMPEFSEYVRQNEPIHKRVNCYSIDQAGNNRVSRKESELAADQKEKRYHDKRDGEVNGQTKDRGSSACLEGYVAQETTGDPLQATP